MSIKDIHPLDQLLGGRLEFSRRWLEEFANYKSGIAAACESLLGVLDYIVPKTANVKEDVTAISSKDWFHRRVFDIYLWHEGG